MTSDEFQHERRDDLMAYLRCMVEIRERIEFLVYFINEKASTGSIVVDTEIACLQYRKILELIALGSIAPNRQEYAKMRSAFHRDWNARLVMQDVERINPHFYPKPLRETKPTDPRAKLAVEFVTDGVLTKDELLQVHATCGGFLHAENPFATRRDVEALRQEFPGWMDRIVALIAIHQVTLINSAENWLVYLKASDNKTHIYPFVNAPGTGRTMPES